METDTINVELTFEDTTTIVWALVALREMAALNPQADPNGEVSQAISVVDYKLSYAITDQKLA